MVFIRFQRQCRDLVFLLYLLLSEAIIKKDQNLLKAQLAEYGAVYEQTYRSGGALALGRWIERNPPSRFEGSSFVHVVTPDRQTIMLKAPQTRVGSDLLQVGPFVVQLETGLMTLSEESERDLVISTMELSDGNYLQIGLLTDNREILLEPFRHAFLLCMLPILALGFVGGAVFAHRAMRPVRNVIKTADEIIDTGKLEARVPMRNSDDELDDLADLFNRMLDKNQALITSMREAFG